MANIIHSIGYSIGKIHVGMINYLCDLYMEGNQEPFRSFFTALDVSLPSNPIARREWNSVDLAILEKGEDGQEIPRILIEMKVDDHESGSTPENYQTVRYASRWPSCQAYLFVTLGKGEYYRAPRNDQFTWIRIRQFQRALEGIKAQDSVISDWLNEVNREILLQDNVLLADKSHADEYRGGTWNIYLLGQLAEMLRPQFIDGNIDVELTCYTYGPRPDTILNFGWAQEPLYMEINYSGRLNLKMSLDTSVSVDDRREIVKKEIIKCEERMKFEIPPTFHPGGKIGGSKTIASFDVGLSNMDGMLECHPSIEAVKQRIFSVVNTFYGKSTTIE